MENSTKLTIVYLMEILRQRTDRAHRLTQQELVDVMRKEYGIECERKSVSRNINALISAGYPIQYRQGYFWEHESDEEASGPVLRPRPAGERAAEELAAANAQQRAELRALAHEAQISELESKLLKAEANISVSETRAKAEEARAKAAKQRAAVLEEKLQELESRVRGPISTLRHYTDLCGEAAITPDYFESFVKPADAAIDNGRQLSFYYNSFDHHKNLVPITEERYLVNPYHIFEDHHRLFLLCSHASNPQQLVYLKFRRMSDVRAEASAALPFDQVQPGFSPKQHFPGSAAERLYMLSGDPQVITMRVDAGLLCEVIDWFGSEVEIKPSLTKKYMVITLRANPSAMIFWAMQYGGLVEIQQPQFLRQAVADALDDAIALYSK